MLMVNKTTEASFTEVQLSTIKSHVVDIKVHWNKSRDAIVAVGCDMNVDCGECPPARRLVVTDISLTGGECVCVVRVIVVGEMTGANGAKSNENGC